MKKILRIIIVVFVLTANAVFSQEVNSSQTKPSVQNAAPFNSAGKLENNVFDIPTCSTSVVPPTVLGGINVTSTFSGSVNTYPTAYTSCPGAYTTPANSIWLGSAGPFSYTFNFSAPVNNLVIVITATGQIADEIFHFTTNVGNPTIIDNGSCVTTVTGNTITSGNGGGFNGGGGIFTIVTSVPFSSMTIDGPGGVAGSLFALCSQSVVPATCNVGSVAPNLSANTLSANCTSTTVNLNSISSSNTPTATGVTLQWFSGATPSTTNQLTNIQASNATAGPTYYAAFFDSVNNCYSAVTPVTTTQGSVVTPTFTQLGPICEGGSLAALPTTSNNGISGSWSPAINNTATTTYTFTPTNPLCTNTQTMTIVVNQKVEPIFSIPNALCYAASLILPSISDNGINGTWNPAANNLATTTYTFTPNPGECAISKTQTVSIFEDFDFEIVDDCVGSDYILSVNPIAKSFDINSATYNWQYTTTSVGNNTDFDVTTFVKDNSLSEQLPITISLTVTDSDGCSKTKQFLVESIFCGIQKGVSANGDGDNDFFDLSLLNVKKLEIFNRYGVKVYSKENYYKEWHGQSNEGKNLPDATYYYVIEFKNNSKSKTGWIYLNRPK
ncbi:MAG TPA: gliding motility-associated C-terminal domain-containing protein [Flavobacterium sp.]|uniref:gliding motility-associated C-terminal domain-containing protein n=1 Tax=Flavobacterium sp. TaxID=239 RepID=UPI002C91D3B7|nr:gliding motility-associated C-terminal domain-containing protein [Flavobacterium sp.]HNP33827.1 gliding motility-associated C-terminal domain-containing protein [Flavobacterium sp.]